MGSQGYNGLPNYYVESSNPLTPNLGLSLIGMDPIVAENFVLLDTAVGAGSSVRVNGSVISNVNFINSATVTFTVVGSNVSATTASGGTPGGSASDIQYNNAGVFGGSGAFTFNSTIPTVTINDASGGASIFTGLQPISNPNYFFGDDFTLYLSATGSTSTAQLEIHNIYDTGISIYDHATNGHLGNGPSLFFFSSGGTQTSPTATLNNQALCIVSASGYDGSTYSFASACAYYEAHSTENWSAGHHGSGWDFYSVPNGSVTGMPCMSLRTAPGATSGMAVFGNAVNGAATFATAPAVKNGGTPGTNAIFAIRFGDDSADCPMSASSATLSGSLILNNSLTDGTSSVGTSGQVLSSTVTGVKWVNSLANPMTTAGDIIYENITPAPARLPIGTAGMVLTVVSGLPAWGAPAAGAWASLTGDLTETQVIPWDGGTVGTPDTSLSRIAAGVVGIGTGAAASVAGTLRALSIGVNGAPTLAQMQITASTDSFPGSYANNLQLIDTSFPGLLFTQTSNSNKGFLLAVDNNGFNFSSANGITSGSATTNIFYCSPQGTGPYIRFAATAVAQWGTGDVGISRLGAASLAIGNGTAGNFSGNLKLTGINNLGTYTDGAGSVGTSGQVLTSTATATAWVSAASIGTAWSSLTGTLSNGQVIPYADAGISRLGAASLAIGNGTASDTTGNLSLNRINKAGADFAGQATVTAGSTTKAVAFSANYTGTGQPVIVLTPTSDPLAAGLPVGYWVTYSGGAGAWTGWVLNIQTALAGNVTFNYIVVGVA